MLKGNIYLKGDKSISHRIVIFGSLANEKSKIYNLSNCSDVMHTIQILKDCGIKIKNDKDFLSVTGNTFTSKQKKFDCGNSGSTARFMLGLLPFKGLHGTLHGDDSLSKRPMLRVIEPLEKMGLKITNKTNNLPITFEPSIAKNIDYVLNKPSAQIKTAMILASLNNTKESFIKDNYNTRDHTERIIKYLLNNISYKKQTIKSFQYHVPGDISNAAFIIAAAILIKGSDIILKNVLYNSTRLGFIKVLCQMGADIKVLNKTEKQNEVVADINVKFSPNLRGVKIDKSIVVSMIDEIPIFAMVACFANGMTKVSGAQELRIKESDRINSIVENLKNCGADINEFKDGFTIYGNKKLYYTNINNYNDHRIAMTFKILEIILRKRIIRTNQNLISTSFPEFYTILGDSYV